MARRSAPKGVEVSDEARYDAHPMPKDLLSYGEAPQSGASPSAFSFEFLLCLLISTDMDRTWALLGESCPL